MQHTAGLIYLTSHYLNTLGVAGSRFQLPASGYGLAPDNLLFSSRVFLWQSFDRALNSINAAISSDDHVLRCPQIEAPFRILNSELPLGGIVVLSQKSAMLMTTSHSFFVILVRLRSLT
jgi:hypothetical protein